MARPKVITLSPTALDRDGISAAETLGGATNFTIGGDLASGGSVTFTQPQHVTIYAAGDNSGVVFTVTGTNRFGDVITEDITGPNGTTAVGTKNFATVTQVASDGATTGDVEVGVDGTCESAWYLLDYRAANNFNVGLGCEISSGGSLTYTVQQTFDDPFAGTFNEDSMTAYTHSTLSGETSNQEGNYTTPPTMTRLKITAFTSGTATMNIVQNGGV